MKRGHFMAVCLTAAGVFSMWATPAFAYLGPGAGLSAIGAFLALIVGVIVAFFGFLWYPVKRLLRQRHTTGASPSQPPHTPQAKSGDPGV